MNRRYKVVDAFSAKALLGNPVAVVLDAHGLGSDQMQAITRWLNLSETTFVLPATSSEADYRVRIFNPDHELPFAGHPTLGTAHAAIEAGICSPKGGRLVQECGVGLVPLSIDMDGSIRRVTLQMPPAKHRSLTEPEITELVAILGQPVRSQPAPALIDVGAVWIVAEIDGVDSLLGLHPDIYRSEKFERGLGADGVSLYARSGDVIETRSFAPSSGVKEDPVCGSGNGAIGGFRLRGGQISPGGSYIARQGRVVGKDGFVSVRIDADGHVLVGGACVTTADGTLHIS